jgi:hypothetical protein
VNTSRIRPGGGEFEPPGLFSRFELQRRFLRIAVEIAPEVLKTLRAVYERIGQDSSSWHWPALPPELRQWGERWRLNDPWCYGWARERFVEWVGQGDQIRQETHSFEAMVGNLHELSRATGGAVSIAIVKEIGEEPPFELGYPGSIGPFQPPFIWNTYNETETEFRQRAQRQFQE